MIRVWINPRRLGVRGAIAYTVRVLKINHPRRAATLGIEADPLQ
jgi:hypothetical protein